MVYVSDPRLSNPGSNISPGPPCSLVRGVADHTINLFKESIKKTLGLGELNFVAPE